MTTISQTFRRYFFVALCLTTLRAVSQTGYTWERFSGISNSQGSEDSSTSTPRFYYPNDLVRLADGTLLISDSANHSIRKRAPNGIVTTFVGLSGINGVTNGTGNNARFSNPAAMTMNASGTLYVADTGNNLVRQVTAAAVVTNFVGVAGSYGNTNGAANVATFSYIADLALDSAGNLFIADNENHCVRKVTTAGVVSTFVGSNDSEVFGASDGTGTAARFSYPSSLTFAPDGNLYILDSGNNTIRKATPTGVVTTLAVGAVAGSYAQIEADAAGNLICTDSGNNRIVKIISEILCRLLQATPRLAVWTALAVPLDLRIL